MELNLRVHVIVSGKVQGVFFRSSIREKAQEFGLAGWVRNLNDGRVEAVFEGEKELVENMVKWVRKGPEYAIVEDVKIVAEEYMGELKGFSVLRY
jgi:acylphosphatase